MTPQEIFDTVSDHLFKQGKRSSDNQYCRYHGEDGLKCSVGILVPEEDYFPEMDQGNKTIKTLINTYEDKFPEWMKENLGLLCELQSIHDKQYHWENSKKMLDALTATALAYDIDPGKLDGIYKEFETTKTEEEAE
jgi:hypothetical protein